MKYRKHTIVKTYEDLGGEDDKRLNYVYNIYDANGKWLNVALSLDSAKEYIDSGYDQNYL